MNNSISNYFNAEKWESVLFILVGVAAILFACYFLIKLKLPFYNGMSYPLIAIAIIQLTVGSSVYFRSSKDIERMNIMLQSDSSKIKLEEIPRMELVMKNFIIYRWIEISLILIGLVLFYYFSEGSFWRGIGLGLVIQATFMLVLDYFAESRGKIYLEYLVSVNLK
jgi:hypothetical protein